MQNNLGCWNCGNIEEYPGATNPDIHYLCAVCVVAGLVKKGYDRFLEIEAAQKALRKPKLRIRRKAQTKKEGKQTIGNC